MGNAGLGTLIELFDESSLSKELGWLDKVENPKAYLHIFDLHLKHGTGTDLIGMRSITT